MYSSTLCTQMQWCIQVYRRTDTHGRIRPSGRLGLSLLSSTEICFSCYHRKTVEHRDSVSPGGSKRRTEIPKLGEKPKEKGPATFQLTDIEGIQHLSSHSRRERKASGSKICLTIIIIISGSYRKLEFDLFLLRVW